MNNEQLVHEFPNLENGKELFEKEQIGISPLVKIHHENMGSCVTLGKYRITEWMQNRETLDFYLDNEQGDFIVRLCTTIFTMLHEQQSISKQ